MGSNFLTIALPAMTSNNDLLHVLKASSEQGGVTIVDAYYVPKATTDAGTSHHLYLLNYGTAGTALASGGTVADVGGTAAPFTSGLPAQFTITAAQAFLDQDEWLVLRKTQEGADSDITTNASLVLELVDGVITQG